MLDLWNKDQWEIHIFQGFTHTLLIAGGLSPFLHSWAILVGCAYSLFWNLFWEIQQIATKIGKESYADDVKDFFQRLIGSGLAVGTWYLLRSN